jgi:hypothetical protein
MSEGKKIYYVLHHGKQQTTLKDPSNTVSFKSKRCMGIGDDPCRNKIEVLWIRTYELDDWVHVELSPLCWQCAKRLRQSDEVAKITLLPL